MAINKGYRVENFSEHDINGAIALIEDMIPMYKKIKSLCSFPLMEEGKKYHNDPKIKSFIDSINQLGSHIVGVDTEHDLLCVAEDIKGMKTKIKSWDNDPNNTYSKIENNKIKTQSLIQKNNIKIKNKIMSLISAPIIANTNSVIGESIKTVDLELENLDKYLQKGDLTSAASAYKFLKSFGKESDAKKILDKYGYKVEEKNGKYIISKKVNESSNTTKPSTSAEVVAEETTTSISDTTSNDNNQNQTETVVNTANTNNNSNNNNYSNSSNNGQNVVENTSTEVNNADTNTQGETNTTTSSPTTGIGDSTKESMKETPKNSVVTITDDNKTTTTKKSSGLGAAVPIGLGTIATGAAAVAGVRYVKNRHDNQEEYDENYDDENNNLDDNEEYVDSAQYDDGSSYMDDDYLGPVDNNNNNSSEDSYVDPSDLEETEDFSDDAVLEDLNSNY